MSVYKLEYNFDEMRSDYPEGDGAILGFPEISLLNARLIGIEEFKTPDLFYCQANLKVLSPAYLPYITNCDPIFTQFMLDLIRTSELPMHRLIPVLMFDDTYLDDPFERNKLKKEVKTLDGYFILQFLEYLDVFDYEKSEYVRRETIPGMIWAQEMVLKEPDVGFPNMFRIKEKPSSLFVNEATKTRLEYSNVLGLKFVKQVVS